MHRPGREAQGLEARTAENLVAIGVVSKVFTRFVVRTIDFRDKPTAQADEVGIIAQQRRLSSEVKTARP
jgi:hypothetical protein